jgi:hypothetical protein
MDDWRLTVCVCVAAGYAAREFSVGPPMVGTKKVAPGATLDFVVVREVAF